MNNLKILYNRNRKVIWSYIVIVVVIILIIQFMNYLAGNQNKKKVENTISNNINSNTNTIDKYNQVDLGGDKTIITNEVISDIKKEKIKIIDNFFECLSNKKYNEAYNLLSLECKEEMYPKIDTFKKRYVEEIYKGNKLNIEVENWYNNTYKVNLKEDPMVTGKSNDKYIQDYITIVEDEEDNFKLNINNYIGRKKDIKQKETDNIKIEMIENNTYFDYEKYKFKITNKSDKVILISNKEDTDTMYIKDTKNIKYSAYTHELINEDLIIRAGDTKEIEIKYYSKYISNKKIEEIVFTNIILDYQKYIKLESKINYEDYENIYIQL